MNRFQILRDEEVPPIEEPYSFEVNPANPRAVLNLDSTPGGIKGTLPIDAYDLVLSKYTNNVS